MLGNPTNEKKRDLVRHAKMKPCSDCQNIFAYYVMDLVHLPQFQKSCNLSDYKKHKIGDVVDEIAKCEPVCANCHRERTHIRACS